MIFKNTYLPDIFVVLEVPFPAGLKTKIISLKHCNVRFTLTSFLWNSIPNSKNAGSVSKRQNEDKN